MFGGKGRLGLIVPANNSTLEPDFWSVLPTDTAAYTTRILAKGDLTPAAVERMETNVDRAVEELAATVVDVIAYADMVTTFIMDDDWNDRRADQIAAKAGVPAYTCWIALRAALKELGAGPWRSVPPIPLRSTPAVPHSLIAWGSRWSRMRHWT